MPATFPLFAASAREDERGINLGAVPNQAPSDGGAFDLRQFETLGPLPRGG
jgi:hypothetical protein